MSQSTDTKSPLDAAQKIVAELHGMAKENQTLALKFAMETLRLETLPTGPLAAPLPAHTQSTPLSTPAATPSQAVDIKSFTIAKAPQTDQQFTAVVAYFYQFQAKAGERKEAIDPDVMKEAARLSGRLQVKRWATTLNNAKNAGYLDSVGDGKFKLSSVGENLVAITLPGDASIRPGKSGKARRHKAAKSGKFRKTVAKGK